MANNITDRCVGQGFATRADVDRQLPAQKPVIDAQQEVFRASVPCQVIANACASGTNAIGHAFECVRSGRYQRVLTGGYDALSELVFTGFDSLQASTPEKCRPFDRHRAGMVLGEGAAVLALENLELARKRGAPVLAEIVGYGISTDNFHITQPGSFRGRTATGDGAQLFIARKFQQTKWITSTHTGQRRYSTTQPKERRSARYLMAFQ